MARKRKEKDEEGEKPFKVPKFDEEKFLKTERRKIKITFLASLFAIFMSLICFGFWVLMGKGNATRWPLILLVGIVNAAFIRYIIIRFNIDLTDFTNRNWLGVYATYFFVWLIILIVLVNPPFYDEEKPVVNLQILPNIQEFGGSVFIIAKITDNQGIDKNDIKFNLISPDGSMSNPNFLWDKKSNIFFYEFKDNINSSSEQITYKINLYVEDKSGLTNIQEGSFRFNQDTIRIAPNTDKILENEDVRIYFIVEPPVHRVFYKVDDSNPINMSKSLDSPDQYFSTAEYMGWKSNQNNQTVKLSAEVRYHFRNHFDDDGKQFWFVNYINDTDTYYFSTDDDSSIGTINSDEIPDPVIRDLSAPGFEILALIIAAILITIIFKYKKKNKNKRK
jgi:hypothetical protein